MAPHVVGRALSRNRGIVAVHREGINSSKANRKKKQRTVWQCWFWTARPQHGVAPASPAWQAGAPASSTPTCRSRHCGRVLSGPRLLWRRRRRACRLVVPAPVGVQGHAAVAGGAPPAGGVGGVAVWVSHQCAAEGGRQGGQGSRKPSASAGCRGNAGGSCCRAARRAGAAPQPAHACRSHIPLVRRRAGCPAPGAPPAGACRASLRPLLTPTCSSGRSCGTSGPGQTWTAGRGTAAGQDGG